MDKEKEIQEIAELLCPYNQNYYDCSDCEYCRVINKKDECDLDSFAKKLYEAGYRKADEVRKETAKAILQDFYDQTFEMKDPYNGDVDEQKEVIDRGDILNMAEHFSIKVDV